MKWMITGAIALALAVGLGAFGAHGLKAHLSPHALGWWATAVDYHFWHGLGILAVGLSVRSAPRPHWVHRAGQLFILLLNFKT